MNSDPLANLTQLLRQPLERAGFDLLAPFSVDQYNGSVERSFHLPRPDGTSPQGLLIGNTRALWPRFVSWLKRDSSRFEVEHPLRQYVVESVERAVAALPCKPFAIRWAHDAPPRRIAIQQLAVASGLCWLAPCNLAIHPTVGPWLGLRAALVFKIDAAPNRTPLKALCGDCDSHCLPPLEEALAQSRDPDCQAVRESWRQWLAVREACPRGREWRYSDGQISYHYTKRRDLLRLEVARLSGAPDP